MQEFCLTFSAKAWTKLHWLYSRSNNEVGGFGLAPDANNLLRIEDIILNPQEVSPTFIEWDDEGVSNYMTDMLDEGYLPKQFMRVWIHTHPNMAPTPSITDETTLKDCFGDCDWCIMFILGKNGDYSCRYVNNKNGYFFNIKVYYEKALSSKEKNQINDLRKEWNEEYDDKVTVKKFQRTKTIYPIPAGSYGIPYKVESPRSEVSQIVDDNWLDEYLRDRIANLGSYSNDDEGDYFSLGNLSDEEFQKRFGVM